MQSFLTSLEHHFDQYDWLNRWSQKLGIKGSYIAYIIATVSILMTAKLAGSVAVVHTVIWLYGSYNTYKSLAYVAVHSQSTHSSYDVQDPTNITQPWLTYWSVYMLFRVGEHLADTLFMSVLRTNSTLYTLAKISALVALMLPPCSYYRTVYTQTLEPLFDRYEQQIQRHSTDLLGTTFQVAGEIQQTVFGAIGEHLRSKQQQQQQSLR